LPNKKVDIDETHLTLQIIVGGGKAGLDLATRLSKGFPYSKIVVLEAGQAAADELTRGYLHLSNIVHIVHFYE
jgi:L-2-hydroxyglutarate oxidase LhgO